MKSLVDAEGTASNALTVARRDNLKDQGFRKVKGWDRDAPLVETMEPYERGRREWHVRHGPLVDHLCRLYFPAISERRRGKWYISEPYGIDTGAILQLAGLVLDGWDVSIDSRYATHYAGFTTAIMFRRVGRPSTREDEEMKARLALHRHLNGAVSVVTNATGEREFLASFAEAISWAHTEAARARNDSDSGEPAFDGLEEALADWLKAGVDIVCKLRGYKAETVMEERVLAAGRWPHPNEAPVAEVGAVEPQEVAADG